MPALLRGDPSSYALAAGASLAAAAASARLGDVFLFAPFVLATLFAAWYGGLGPGLLATGLGALLSALTAAPGVGVLLLLATGALVAWLGESLHTARRRLEAEHARFRASDASRAAARHAEDALRHSEQRFRSLVMAITSIVWTTDDDGRFLAPQASWERFTGQSWEEYRGDGWTRAFHPEDRDAIVERWEAARRARIRFDATARLWHAASGGYRRVEARAVPVRDDDGSVREWIGKCLDVENRWRTEAALRDADRSKNEFLATLSHELRNPLAPILNAVHILREQSAQERPIEPRLLEMVDRQLGQMVRLIDDLMDVSRITRGVLVLRREPTDLGSLLKNALAAADSILAARGHRVELGLPDEPLALDGDPVRLAQIFSNLLQNAAKYTERGGRIALRAEREGGEAVVTVEDSGIGIPRDQLPRIFEMFAQGPAAATRSPSGLGIGLTLVKHLCELHGGTVTAQSEGLGRGSSFTVRLPLCPVAPARVAPPAEPAPSPPSAPLACRVLVVDDNEDAADSFALLLASRGAQVRVAHDGLEALARSAEFDPDVVLLDIGLPGMDGYEVCRRLRRAPGGVQRLLLAVTGWGQLEDRQRCLEAGFDRHLVKPVDPDAIETLLRDHTRRRGGAREHLDPVEEASRESFPASDPPAWTGVTAS